MGKDNPLKQIIFVIIILGFIPGTTIKTSEETKMRSHFFFLTTTRAPNNYYQNEPRKHPTSPHLTIQLEKTTLKITDNTKTQDDKEINFKFLTQFDHEYEDVDTKYKILKAIEQLNNQARGMFPDTTSNYDKRTRPCFNKTRNIPTVTTITTSSTETDASNIQKILSDIITKQLKNTHKADISMLQNLNRHDLTMHTTSSWKRNNSVKRFATTPEIDTDNDLNHRHNTRQLNSREYTRSGHITEKLKDMILNYDISRRPEQTRNSLQRFGLVYVPVPLKFKARYNYLNHFPVNPLMQVLLSNYGYYLPGSLGIRRFGLYNHMAYNNIYVNKPFGTVYRYNIKPDREPWYK